MYKEIDKNPQKFEEIGNRKTKESKNARTKNIVNTDAVDREKIDIDVKNLRNEVDSNKKENCEVVKKNKENTLSAGNEPVKNSGTKLSFGITKWLKQTFLFFFFFSVNSNFLSFVICMFCNAERLIIDLF